MSFLIKYRHTIPLNVGVKFQILDGSSKSQLSHLLAPATVFVGFGGMEFPNYVN